MEINLKPEEAWEFFQKNRKRFQEELVEIASNKRTETVVYLTEEKNLPYVIVERDEEEYSKEGCVSDDDLTKALQHTYLVWLQDPGETRNYDANNPEDMEAFEQLMDERESELADAFGDFLTMVTTDPYETMLLQQTAFDNEDKMLEDVLDLLATNYGLQIYRPMVIFDDDEKRDVCTEYPYNEYELGNHKDSQEPAKS